MRKRIILVVVTVVILYELSRHAMQLPGGSKPNQSDNDKKKKPKTTADLHEEFRGKNVSDGIYRTFENAVDLQLQGKDEDAEKEYSKLTTIPRRSGGFFDLSTISRTLKHNIDLLRSKK